MPPLPALPRILRLGSKGRDVRALQRALKVAGFRQEPPVGTNRFDPDTDAEVRAFQGAHDLDVDGEVGKHTYAALEAFYDTRGQRLLNEVANATAETPRRLIAAAAHCGFKNRESIHYTQQAPERMEGVTKQIRPPEFPRFADCSSFVTWCYFAADVRDPNRRGYDGTGYSGSLVQHGTETEHSRVGDIAFYGHSRSEINHVTVCVGNGRVISHGQETGPALYNVDYDRGSAGPFQFVKTYLT